MSKPEVSSCVGIHAVAAAPVAAPAVTTANCPGGAACASAPVNIHIAVNNIDVPDHFVGDIPEFERKFYAMFNIKFAKVVTSCTVYHIYVPELINVVNRLKLYSN